MSVMLSQASARGPPEDRETKSGKNPSTAIEAVFHSGLVRDLSPARGLHFKPSLATTLRWWTWFYVRQRRSSDGIALPDLAQGEKDDLEANYIGCLVKCPDPGVVDPLRTDHPS
jgi:hypothetical protein